MKKSRVSKDFDLALRYVARWRCLRKYSGTIKDEIAGAYLAGLRTGRRTKRFRVEEGK
jgi:hypothetical protein